MKLSASVVAEVEEGADGAYHFRWKEVGNGWEVDLKKCGLECMSTYVRKNKYLHQTL